MSVKDKKRTRLLLYYSLPLKHILHLREVSPFAERLSQKIPGSFSVLNPASLGWVTYGNTFLLHPLNSRYQDMEVKKGEFQVIGRVVKKEKRY